MEGRDYRVPQGGLFHSRKVEYSKETQSLLNRLIEESKLSILQRQAVRESVRRGEPLPGPGGSVSARSQSVSALKSRKGQGEVLVPPALPRRRSYQAIVKSGAYQREIFDPPHNSNMKDREIEKQKLQSLMTYGKNVPADPHEKPKHRLKQKKEEEETGSEELFNHLVEEIKERLEFLQEMEKLGEVKSYQTVMEQEIAAKMRQMAKIDQKKFLEIGDSLRKNSSANQKGRSQAKLSSSLESNILKS